LVEDLKKELEDAVKEAEDAKVILELKRGVGSEMGEI